MPRQEWGGIEPMEKIFLLTFLFIGLGDLSFKEQCPGGFPTALLNLSSNRKSKNVLLLSKRKHVMIPVGNLKVDSP
jgi:hypothetical protein